MKFTPYKYDNHTLIAPERLLSNEATKPFHHLPPPEHPPLDPHYKYDPELQTFLTDKLFPLNELPFTIEHIHEHYLHGCLTYQQGLPKENKTLRCQRCGNSDPELFASYLCSRCGSECAYCRQCLMMGVVKACTPLVSWSGPPISYPLKPHPLPQTLQLSPLQSQASKAVVQAMRQGQDLLVWAVCIAENEDRKIIYPIQSQCCHRI